ncbi:PWWP domain-containing protein 2 [Linum perenne]
MDGGEDKDVTGSFSTVTVTEPVVDIGADCKKLPAASVQVETNVEDERIAVEKSGGGGSCNGVEKEVGVSGSGDASVEGCGDGVRNSGYEGGEKLKSRVVLGFDGHEVDLERDAEEEEEEGGTGIDDLGSVQDRGDEAWSPITTCVEVEEGVGKDGEGSCSEVKVDDKALPEVGGDGNPSAAVRTSGEGASLNEESLENDVTADGDTELVEGSSAGETVVAETQVEETVVVETQVEETIVIETQVEETVVIETQVVADSNDAETCVKQGSMEDGDGDTQVMAGFEGEEPCSVQVSVDRDTQIMDDVGDSDAELNNDASADGETQVVTGLLNHDTQAVGISEGREIRLTGPSSDGDSKVNDDTSDGVTQVTHSSPDDTQVIEDPDTHDMDVSKDVETEITNGSSGGESQVADGDSKVNDHTNNGIAQVTHNSPDDTQVIEDPDTHDVDVSMDRDTKITNDFSGGETQVVDDSLDAETEAVNGSVDAEEQVKVADIPAVSKDGNVERVLREETAPIPIEDLNSQEVSASEQDINDPGMTSGLEGTCGATDQVSAATEKAELPEESLGKPMEIVEAKEGVDQYSEFKSESAFLEDLGQKSQVLEEAQVVMVNDDSPPCEVMGDPLEKVPRIDTLEGMTSSSVDDSVLMEKTEIEYPTSETLDKIMQVSVQGNIPSVDDGEITCPNIEGMDADAFNENFCFSVEELQASGETINGSTEHHYNAIADLPSFSQPSDVFIGGEVAGTMEEKKQQDIRVGGKLVEAGKEGVANSSIRSPDSTSSFHSTQAVAGDDVGEMDHIVGLDASPYGDNQSASFHNDISASNADLMKASVNNVELAVNETMMVHPVDVREHEGFAKDAEETSVLDAEQVCQHDVKERGAEEPDTTEEKYPKWANLHRGSFANAQQAKYQLPSDFDGEFCVSDLVWGKVRSHPRWPGQIFDPADASEQALRYQKKDSFLVAYFGDRTFAWNEPHLLKPFRSHFSQSEKQSNSEAFQNAVDSALEEVSRRVELGLACSCVPSEDRYKIELELVGNAGIQEEAVERGDVDISRTADMFKPANLINYVKSLAQSPVAGADRVDLVILRSQLFSFYRLKGYSPLPEFQCFGESLEDGEAVNHAGSACEDDLHHSTLPDSQTQRPYYHKRKHNLKDGVYRGKKVKSLAALIDDSWDSVEDETGADGKIVSPSSAKRRKGPDPFADESTVHDEVKTISLAKISTASSAVPKPSFRIGECIRRAASQMTASPSILKSNSQKFDDEYDYSMPQCDEEENNSLVGISSLDELLLQLRSAARDPLQRCSFLNVIVSFFSDYRNSVVVDQQDVVDKRRKVFHSVGDSATFEFVDMNDTYWTDRVIENGSEEKPARKSKKRENLFIPVSLDKPVQRSNVRKRYSDGNFNVLPEKPPGYVDEKAPAELVMHFPVADSIPSEMKLNKMFKCFGPLKESGTEVDRDTNRARVVFKHSSDAEAAHGSASKFNIFGSLLVNYQLNYIISVPFKSEPLSLTHGDEDANVFLQY